MIKINKTKTGWYFLVRSRNGRTLCHSETYSSKQACQIGVKSLIRNVQEHAAQEEMAKTTKRARKSGELS